MNIADEIVERIMKEKGFNNPRNRIHFKDVPKGVTINTSSKGVNLFFGQIISHKGYEGLEYKRWLKERGINEY